MPTPPPVPSEGMACRCTAWGLEADRVPPKEACVCAALPFGVTMRRSMGTHDAVDVGSPYTYDVHTLHIVPA
jgi:hypothetical protein